MTKKLKELEDELKILKLKIKREKHLISLRDSEYVFIKHKLTDKQKKVLSVFHLPIKKQSEILKLSASNLYVRYNTFNNKFFTKEELEMKQNERRKI